MLGRWRKEYQNDSRQGIRGHGVNQDEELTSLKLELTRVKKERNFLKEAAAFFYKLSK